MRNVATTFSLTVAVAILIGVAFVAGCLSWAIVRDMTGQLAVTILTAISAVIAGVWTLRANNKREVEGRQFPEKAQVYLEALEIIKYFSRNSGVVHDKDSEIVNRMNDFQYKMLIWSSPEAVRSFGEFGSDPGGDVGELFAKVAYFYGWMRRDLGHSDSARDCVDMMVQMITPAERGGVRALILGSRFYRDVLLKRFRAS
jgi:hypothetical protein